MINKLVLALAFLIPSVSFSQSITPNYQGAEVAQIAEAVGVITGKNFIIDPRVKSQVTMVSSVPMTPDEFYNAFLSILQVHGFMAIPDGPNTLRIVPGVDVPGNSKVRYLKYADAEKLAPKLAEQLGDKKGGDQSVKIWAEPSTNALVITAPPNTMSAILSIVDQIDIRRAQVLVEAILVEMSTTKAIELGINWNATYSNDSGYKGRGSYINPVDGVSLGDIINGEANPPETGGGLFPNGLTFGIGRVAATGLNWTALVRALQSDTGTNIIATPSIIALDNEEAEIKIAQEVPFVTGQYTSQGVANSVGNVNPFQTITREEVGNILKITPQINEGDAILLKISQEASNLSPSKQAVDLITNKRVITTKIMADDGEIIVLGGLISEEAQVGKQQTPLLGSIPFIGELFKTRQTTKKKTTLMVFIRPVILRNGTEASQLSEGKYNNIRQEQEQYNDGKVPLMPKEKQPVLPSTDPLPQQ